MLIIRIRDKWLIISAINWIKIKCSPWRWSGFIGISIAKSFWIAVSNYIDYRKKNRSNTNNINWVCFQNWLHALEDVSTLPSFTQSFIHATSTSLVSRPKKNVKPPTNNEKTSSPFKATVEMNFNSMEMVAIYFTIDFQLGGRYSFEARRVPSNQLNQLSKWINEINISNQNRNQTFQGKRNWLLVYL